jgi:hypothetical protein
VTDLSTLRIAQWLSAWTNKGNFGTTGSAGASGSVTSNQLVQFDPTTRYFTLASTAGNQNPLPVRWIHLSARQDQDQRKLNWSIPGDWPLKIFTLEKSIDGQHFSFVQKIPFIDGRTLYEFEYGKPPNVRTWVRVKAIDGDSIIITSNPVRISINGPETEIHIEQSIISSQQLIIRLRARKEGKLNLVLFNGIGECLMEKQVMVIIGSQEIHLQMPLTGKGIFYLYGWNKYSRSNLIRLVR